MRWVLGPIVSGPINDLFDFGDPPIPVPAPGPAGKQDVTVEIVGVGDRALEVEVAVPAYDAATHNTLEKVRVVYAAAPVPAEPSVDYYTDSAQPYAEVDVPTGGGVTAVLRYTGEPFYHFRQARAILGFTE